MICLPTIHVLLLLCFIIGITAWYTSFKENTKIIYIGNLAEHNIPPINNHNRKKELELIHSRDRAVLNDSFHPPERRVPEYQYPTRFMETQINIPSRGYPEQYQILGNVFREKTETAYTLYGRQTYPGSDQYEYYVTGNDTNTSSVKIPIRTRGSKEIMNHDIINIPGTDKTKGEFKVELYKFDVPRYIPI
jgi:hypothetical protein